MAFLNAKGGRGKTYVLNAIVAAARAMNIISLATCFTGLASQDYKGGMTCHRAFKLPVRADGDDGDGQLQGFSSHLSADDGYADVLRETGLIVIDEAPMAGRRVVSAVLSALHMVDAGVATPRTIILSGDFQQIAPVVTNAGRLGEVDAWLSRLPQWQGVELHRLERPMRQSDGPFDDFVQTVGAGSVDVCHHLDPLLETCDVTYANYGRAKRGVRLPTTMFQHSRDAEQAVRWAFPRLHLDESGGNANSAILSVLHANVRQLNELALRLKLDEDGEAITPLRGFTKIRDYQDADMDDERTSEDFLNSLNHTGVPPAEVPVSVGCVCLLMRNLNRSWCNGQRVVVRSIRPHTLQVVRADRWRGVDPQQRYTFDEMYRVPRISFEWKLRRTGVTVSRTQFPLQVRPRSGRSASWCRPSESRSRSNIDVDVAH